MGGMTIRLLRGWLFVLMFVARRVDSRNLLTCRNGDEKEWTRNHKIGSAFSFFFHSSGVFVSSNQICIYYDSSRFCSPLAFLLLLCYEWKRDIISNSGDIGCDDTQGRSELPPRQCFTLIWFLPSSSCTDRTHRIIQTIPWSHFLLASSLRTKYSNLFDFHSTLLAKM